MRLLLLSLLLSAQAFATNSVEVKGTSDASHAPAVLIQVPFTQNTKVKDKSYRFETGSENLLANSNFEASTLNWSFSGGGAGATAANNTTFSPILEKQDMRINTGASGGIVVAASFNAGAGLTGTNGQYYCRFHNNSGSTPTTVTMTISDVGISNIYSTTTFVLPANGAQAPRYGSNFVFPITTALEISITDAAASADFSVDDCYVGPALNISSANPNIDWTAYTPTFTGFGTVTVSNCAWAKDAADLLVRCVFTAGTATAVEARISLPNSLVSSSSLPTLSIVGNGGTATAGAEYDVALIEPSVSYLTFGYATAGAGALNKANGSSITASGRVLSYNARIPIQLWSGQNATTPNCTVGDGSCENEFSAVIDLSANATSLSTPGWLGNGVISDTSLFTMPFKTGLFSVAPNCTLTIDQPSTGSSMTSVLSGLPTTAQVVIRTGYAVAGSSFVKSTYISSIHCSRVGTDRKPVMSAPIISGNITTNDLGSWRTEGVKLTTASSGNCTIVSQSGSFLSTSTGSTTAKCTSAFTTAFSSEPICSCLSDPGTGAAYDCNFTTKSATGFTVQSYTLAGTNTVTTIDILCFGPR